jgi:hypothetical protein
MHFDLTSFLRRTARRFLIFTGTATLNFRFCELTHYFPKASLKLAEPPHLRPVIGDYDNDGINDVLLIGEESLLGVSLERNLDSVALLVLVIVSPFQPSFFGSWQVLPSSTPQKINKLKHVDAFPQL